MEGLRRLSEVPVGIARFRWDAGARKDLRRRQADPSPGRGPESRPGEQRGPSARHHPLLAGHARYPFRLRLPHRRGGRLQSGRRRRLPGRRGLRHQLWVPPAGHRSGGERHQGQGCGRWWISSSGMCRRGWVRREPSPAVPPRSGEAAGAAAPPGRWNRATAPSADLDHTEDGGALAGADPDAISERAYTRGQDQVGTLGSGNHFLECRPSTPSSTGRPPPPSGCSRGRSP